MEKQEWKATQLRLSQLGDRHEVQVSGPVKRSEEFQSEWLKNSRTREETFRSVSRKLGAFRHSLSSIQQRLNDFSHAASGADGIQELLESFEGKVSTYKMHMREDFGKLLHEEQLYTSEVESMMKKIEDWEADSEARKMSNKRNVKAPQSPNSRRKSVQERYEKDLERQTKLGAIDRQIASIGGRNGGWENNENDLFLKVWTQTVTTTPISATEKRSLLKRVCPLLPGKTAEEAEDHILFYTNYLDLTEKKKAILNAWKDEQLSKRRAKEGETLARAIEQSPPRPGESTEAKIARRERISKWKTERAEKAKAEEDSEKQRVLEQTKNRQAERMMAKQSNQLLLEQWKVREMEAKTRVDAAKKVTERPRTVDPAQIERQRERDVEFIKKAAEMKKKVELKKGQRARIQRQLERDCEYQGEAPITRDTERLIAPTSAFEFSRITVKDREDAKLRRESQSAHSSSMAGTGRDLVGGGRATATWMAGPK